MFIVVDGSQVNGERTGFASDGAATRTYNLGTRPLTPDPERLCSEEPMMNGLQEVAAHTKEILNRSVHREKALRLRSRFKALHLALALPDWLVGGFSATVGVSVKPRCKPPGKERSGRREGYPSQIEKNRKTKVEGMAYTGFSPATIMRLRPSLPEPLAPRPDPAGCLAAVWVAPARVPGVAAGNRGGEILAVPVTERLRRLGRVVTPQPACT